MKELLKDLYQIWKLLIVILTPIVLLPIPLAAGGKLQEAECGYVILIMAVFWVTEALPISVTALLPVFLFPVVGILSVKDASQQYINNKSMLFVGGFIVAAAIERWNIHRRIALKIVYMFGTEPRWLMLGLMLPTWFLSMWICNTSTTALMLPIAHAILLQLRDTNKHLNNEIHTGHTNEGIKMDDSYTYCNGVEVKVVEMKQNGQVFRDNSQKELLERESDSTLGEDEDPEFLRLCKALTLGIGYAANVGGIATMTGAIPNLVFIGILDKTFEKYGIESPITFANWMGFLVPTSLVLLLLVWIWLQIYFLCSLRCCRTRNEETTLRIKELIKEEYRKLGPITFGQGAVISHFVVLIVLWITRDMGGEAGWGHLFKKSYVREAVPAILIAILLFIFPSKLPRIFCCRQPGEREQPEPLITWKAATDRVPWGIVFLLGSGFCVAKACQVSGLSEWLASKLSEMDHLDPVVLNLVMCFIMSAMTEFISNPAICALMMPILSSLAIGLKLNPLYLMFPSAIASSFAFMFPAASPPNAIVFSYGYVKVIDTVLAGFMVNIVSVLLLIGSTETIGESLFNFHTVPPAMLNNMTMT